MKKWLLLYFCAGLAFTLTAQDQFGITLNGTAGSLRLCDAAGFPIEGGFTVEAWIYSPEWKPEFWQGSVVNKDATNPDAGWALRAGQGGRLNFVMSVDGRWFEVATDALMNLNQWYHVAATVGGGVATLYIDGVPQAAGSFSGTPALSSAPLTIGDSPGFPGRVFNGTIDEVRVWEYARSEEELLASRTIDLTGTEDSLVTYLPFREGAGLSSANLAQEDCAATFTGLGEEAWGEGYSVPTTDVGVSAITAPDALAVFSRPVKAQVIINNYGREAVFDVPVTLSVNGTPLLQTTFTDTIPAGGEATLVFEQPVDLTNDSLLLLTAGTTLAADMNGLNDEAAITYRRPGLINTNPAISLFSSRQHNFGSAGQTQSTTVNLPLDMERYERLLLHLSVTCPSTGCDPWDQTGNLSVVTPGGELEIARFITPYRIPCGGPEWVVDVTDFKDLLAGTVSFKSFIQVWGPSGWLLNADLEMVAGSAAPRYTRSTPVYNRQYHVYGDPNIDDDLPMRMVSIAPTTEESRFRLTMSGHGQGNTDNAAEFLERTHQLVVNGAKVADHRLWKADCADNTCSNQLGTWRFNRAGWCPGQAVQPWSHALSPDLTGTELTLDYELQEYTNLLNTGYDGAGHTEPFYRIAGYLIENSSVAYSAVTNLRADSVVLFVAGSPGDPTGDELILYLSNTGTEVVPGGTVAFYVDDNLVAEETFTDTIAPGTGFVYTFAAPSGITDYETAAVTARVTTSSDDNVSDDATAALTVLFSVSTTEARDAGLRIYPNPTSGQVTVELSASFIGGRIEEVEITGRVLSTQTIGGTHERLSLTPGSGMRVLRIFDRGGRSYFEKVVVR